ncbi:hypothetical protein [Paraburkholderia hospita]|uniref:hypothetical protein n=1 Tax=Paraburkholderia hospita TaxID=169430 RepID=UPI000DEFEC09|nr:hypothetical protein CUJ88_43740 [Paraburkholderia hospita]
MPLFHALKPDGVLMLGPSETVGAFSELFGVIENRRSKLYSKKPRLGPRTQMRLQSTRVAPLAAPAGITRERRVDRIALAQYAPSKGAGS